MKAPNWLIAKAISEDLGKNGDVTTAFFVPKDAILSGRVVLKADGVVCGVEIAAQVFRKISPSSHVSILIKDGEKAKTQDAILTVRGNRKILTAERIALNFLQRLSGIATLTAEFSSRIKGTKAKIYDTRKTLPGWRVLEKYAVRCGGGENHRFGLYDMALLKDNHWAFGSLKQGIFELKRKHPEMKIEIEADRIERVQKALQFGADMILLDNMSPQEIKFAIKLIRRSSPKTEIEISGGVNIKNVRTLARLSPDRISIGRITHSAPALDMSLEIP